MPESGAVLLFAESLAKESTEAISIRGHDGLPTLTGDIAYRYKGMAEEDGRQGPLTIPWLRWLPFKRLCSLSLVPSTSYRALSPAHKPA